MLSLSDFKRISLEDKPIFDALYSMYPPMHSDNMFTTMVSWGEYVEYRYIFVEKNLVVMTKTKNGKINFRPPSGKQNPDLVRQVLELAKREGSEKPFVLIDHASKEWIEKVFPKLRFEEDRDLFDYVYRSSDLAELPGTTYGKIRNRLHKFERNYTYTTEYIAEENMEDIREFLKRWCLWKDCESDELLENERKAILFSMDHFYELGLSGLAMRIQGKVEAIAVFEQMNQDTIVIHYEKGTPEFDGIYKAINRETAKHLQKKFMYINRETDMGVAGLRKAKLSYHPHHMIEMFSVKKQYIEF